MSSYNLTTEHLLRLLVGLSADPASRHGLDPHELGALRNIAIGLANARAEAPKPSVSATPVDGGQVYSNGGDRPRGWQVQEAGPASPFPYSIGAQRVVRDQAEAVRLVATYDEARADGSTVAEPAYVADLRRLIR
jgi:hypothetical protein